jgi:hypothetical protein
MENKAKVKEPWNIGKIRENLFHGQEPQDSQSLEDSEEEEKEMEHQSLMHREAMRMAADMNLNYIHKLSEYQQDFEPSQSSDGGAWVVDLDGIIQDIKVMDKINYVEHAHSKVDWRMVLMQRYQTPLITRQK